jgi:DNA polymerase-3 subunit alpha
LARQVQHLLLRLGIISHLRTVNFPYKEGRIGYQVFVVGRENFLLFAETIGSRFASTERRAKLERILVGGLGSYASKDVIPLSVKNLVRQCKEASGFTWDQVHEHIGVAPREFYATSTATKSGFARMTIGRLAEFFDSDELRAYSDSDVYWDKVVSIEYVGEEMTYDLTVPDTHNFIANDIIVHNSHAADYAMMTCQTAYLKCHYPHEYMAALMSVHRDDSAKVGLFAADCHRLGIDVLPPTVNGSQLDFGIEKQRDGKRAVRFGLGAIKNLGVGPVEHIIEQRNQGGRFRDLDDFCRRVDTRIVNKRALESLIKVGALDEFAPRPVLLSALDRIISFSSDLHKAKDSGQISLFGDETGVDFGAQESILANIHDIDQVTQREMLNWEKELVGLYVTDHPLSGLRDLYANSRITTSAELVEAGEEANGKAVTVAGLVAAVRKVTTKKGDMMAILTLEDITGTVGAVMFPRTWDGYRHMIEEDAVVIVMGKADTSRGDLQIIVESVSQEMEIATLADKAPNLDMKFSWLEDEPGESPAPEEAAPPVETRVIHEEPAVASEPPPDLGPTTDQEMPGWLEEEMDHNGWAPKPDIEYSETGYVQSVEKREAEAAPPPATPTPKPEREPLRRPRPQPPQPAPDLPPGRMLTLHIERSGDAAKDKRRIQNLHGRLIQVPGRDHFRFVLRGGGVKAVCMNFPQHPIEINDEVLDMVITQLGEENVEIGE